MSLEKAREQLLLAFDDKLISEEEFVLLYDLNSSRNLDLPYEQYSHFDLDDMENDECLSEFRAKKHDLPLLAEVLQIPPVFICDQSSVVGGMEGLCMLLKKAAYPCRYSDICCRDLAVLFLSCAWRRTAFSIKSMMPIMSSTRKLLRI